MKTHRLNSFLLPIIFLTGSIYHLYNIDDTSHSISISINKDINVSKKLIIPFVLKGDTLWKIGNNLVDLSTKIAQLEIEIEQLKSNLSSSPDAGNKVKISNQISDKNKELNACNNQIKIIDNKREGIRTTEIISLQELLNLESTISNKKIKIQTLESLLIATKASETNITLLSKLEKGKTDLAKAQLKSNYLEQDGNTKQVNSENTNIEEIKTDIKRLENQISEANIPDTVLSLVTSIENNKQELLQLEKGLEIIKEKKAGGIEWQDENEYRILNLLNYINKIEDDIEAIDKILQNQTGTNSNLIAKKELKQKELTDLIADLKLAGGKYTPRSASVVSQQSIDSQVKIEQKKSTIDNLKAELNQLNDSTKIAELTSSIKTREKELNELKAKEEDSSEKLNNTEVEWEGNMKYEDYRIAKLMKYINEVEEEISLIHNNIDRPQSKSKLTEKNNELDQLIAELGNAGGSYTKINRGINLDKESIAEEVVAEEVVAEEIVAEEIVAEEIVAEEIVAEEIVAEEIVAEEIVAEKPVELQKEADPLFSDKTEKKDKPNKPLKVGDNYLLNNILFRFDNAEVQQKSYADLDKLVDILKKNIDKRVELSGHTDDWGPANYNQWLSEERAKAVANYLVSKGINRKQLTVKGYGETKPVAPNLLPNGKDNYEGRKKNRRTEMKIIG